MTARTDTYGPTRRRLRDRIFRHVVVDKEGFETARWLAARGLPVFVLFYRQPADGWGAVRTRHSRMPGARCA